MIGYHHDQTQVEFSIVGSSENGQVGFTCEVLYEVIHQLVRQRRYIIRGKDVMTRGTTVRIWGTQRRIKMGKQAPKPNIHTGNYEQYQIHSRNEQKRNVLPESA